MSFEISHDDFVRRSVDIVNEDFDYQTFSQAFAPNDIWTRKNNTNTHSNGLPGLNGKFVRNHSHTVGQSHLKTCPPMNHAVFNFQDVPSKQEFPPGFHRNSQQSHNNERLENVMQESNVRNAINSMMNKNGVDQSVPILKVQVVGNPNYELSEVDILDSFSTYGKVVNIELGRNRTAYIMYDDVITALFAQKSLNGQYVKNLDVKFYVSWSNTLGDEKVEDKQAQSNNSIRRGPVRSNSSRVETVSQSMPNLDDVCSMNSMPFNLPKFTCKYEIQLDKDRDFKIARKIIGPRGCNMKKIIEICQHQLKRLNVGVQSDFLKLRLRGIGSGFKEGPEQRESNDPLHLCVSSKHSEVYHLACNLVEDLLNGLYKEYEGFCAKLGRPLKKPVQIKRVEIYNTGSEKKAEEGNRFVAFSLQSIPDLDLSPAEKESLSTGKSSNGKDSVSPAGSLTGLSDKGRDSSPETI